jgi:hypothetical protein
MIFFDLEEIIFENFNISENNIISVKLAKVLLGYVFVEFPLKLMFDVMCSCLNFVPIYLYLHPCTSIGKNVKKCKELISPLTLYLPSE